MDLVLRFAPLAVSLLTVLLVAWLNFRNSSRLRVLERAEEAKGRFSTPLAESAQVLHNKLNSILCTPRTYVGNFSDLGTSLASCTSIGVVLEQTKLLYIVGVLYAFANFLGNVVALRRNLGRVRLGSPEEVEALYLRVRQTQAVFWTGRLHEGFPVRDVQRTKYRGTILGPAQILIGEAVVQETPQGHTPVSLYEFCSRLLPDDDFRRSFRPLVNLFGDLERIPPDQYEKASADDMRWGKLVLFTRFLRKLVREAEPNLAKTLLPELGEQQKLYLDKGRVKANIDEFKQAYPDPRAERAHREEGGSPEST